MSSANWLYIVTLWMVVAGMLCALGMSSVMLAGWMRKKRGYDKAMHDKACKPR